MNPTSTAPSLRIVHSLCYYFADSVERLAMQVRLRPRDTSAWRCASSQLVVRPTADETREVCDVHGNHLSELTLRGPFQKLELDHLCRLEPNEHVEGHHETWAQGWEALQLRRDAMAAESTRVVLDSEFSDFARSAFPPARPIADCLVGLSDKIRSRVRYDVGAASAQSPADTLEKRKGVCEDFAHLAIACLRSLELPARYVSGYRLASYTPKSHVEPHAWVAVRTSDDNWLAFDPTVGELCADRHVTVAWGRDREDVAMVSGTLDEGGLQRLESSVTVECIDAQSTDRAPTLDSTR